MNPDTDSDDGPSTDDFPIDGHGELLSHIEHAIGSTGDERVEHIEDALAWLDEYGHPQAAIIEGTLESARSGIERDTHESNILGDLRGAYGTVPLGPEHAEKAAEVREERLEAATGRPEGGQAVTVDDGDDRADVLRKAFADFPTVENPSDMERARARLRYPAPVVPDEGPIPDPDHVIRHESELDLPLWALESVAHRLQRYDEPSTVFDAESLAMEYAQAWERFTVHGGEATLREALEESYGIELYHEDA